jgi:hypothetical protein
MDACIYRHHATSWLCCCFQMAVHGCWIGDNLSPFSLHPFDLYLHIYHHIHHIHISHISHHITTKNVDSQLSAPPRPLPAPRPRLRAAGRTHKTKHRSSTGSFCAYCRVSG